MRTKLIVFTAVAIFLTVGLLTVTAGIPQFFSGIFDFGSSELTGNARSAVVEKDSDKTENEAVDNSESIPLYKPVIDYENAVIAAVESANPAVVSVVVTKNLPAIERCIRDPFFGDETCFFDDERVQETGSGTGFIVSEDGMIVTNKHVVRDESADYTVLTNDGERYPAEVLARDPFQDIAIMKIETSGLASLSLGDSDKIKLGQTAIAIGNALGEFRNTVSVGVISGFNRNITAMGFGGVAERLEGVLQTDAAINRGNSGGPLINLKGEVVGVNTAVAIGAQNIGFAIPINRVRRAIESVIETGRIQAPFLGVRYLIITPEMAKEENLPVNHGALVRGSGTNPGVMSGTAAAEAGMQENDIILEFDGKRISPENSLAKIIQDYRPGDSIKIKILREEEEKILSATLGEWDL